MTLWVLECQIFMFVFFRNAYFFFRFPICVFSKRQFVLFNVFVYTCIGAVPPTLYPGRRLPKSSTVPPSEWAPLLRPSGDAAVLLEMLQRVDVQLAPFRKIHPLLCSVMRDPLLTVQFYCGVGIICPKPALCHHEASKSMFFFNMLYAIVTLFYPFTSRD